MSASDFVQKWSGVGTFVIAFVAVLTWLFGMRDETVDAKLEVVNVEVEAVSHNVTDLRRDMDRRFDDLEKLLGVKLDTMDERYEGLSVRLENTNVRLTHVHDRLQDLALAARND